MTNHEFKHFYYSVGVADKTSDVWDRWVMFEGMTRKQLEQMRDLLSRKQESGVIGLVTIDGVNWLELPNGLRIRA